MIKKNYLLPCVLLLLWHNAYTQVDYFNFKDTILGYDTTYHNVLTNIGIQTKKNEFISPLTYTYLAINFQNTNDFKIYKNIFSGQNTIETHVANSTSDYSQDATYKNTSNISNINFNYHLNLLYNHPPKIILPQKSLSYSNKIGIVLNVAEMEILLKSNNVNNLAFFGFFSNLGLHHQNHFSFPAFGRKIDIQSYLSIPFLGIAWVPGYNNVQDMFLTGKGNNNNFLLTSFHNQFKTDISLRFMVSALKKKRKQKTLFYFGYRYLYNNATFFNNQYNESTHFLIIGTYFRVIK